jgi:hypothetical protein
MTISCNEIPHQSVVASEESGEDRKYRILRECEEYLREFRRLRNLGDLKATGKSKTGRINPSSSSRQQLRVNQGEAITRVSRGTGRTKVTVNDKTKGIEASEIQRWRLAGEC